MQTLEKRDYGRTHHPKVSQGRPPLAPKWLNGLHLHCKLLIPTLTLQHQQQSYLLLPDLMRHHYDQTTLTKNETRNKPVKKSDLEGWLGLLAGPYVFFSSQTAGFTVIIHTLDMTECQSTITDAAFVHLSGSRFSS